MFFLYLYFFAATQNTAEYINCQYSEIINESVQKYPFYSNDKPYYIPTALVKAFIHQESGGNPKAISRANARGVMQIIPRTSELLKCDWNKLDDPAFNINCGVKYLAALFTHTNNIVQVISSYNAGYYSTTNSDLFGGKVADNAETRNYVPSVLRHYEYYQKKNKCTK